MIDPKDNKNVYIYVSGTSFVRPGEEFAGCSDGTPDKDPNTSLFRIDVIKVPVATPQDAKIVSSPRLFLDSRTGAINGLHDGGSHDRGGKAEDDTISVTTSPSIRKSDSPPALVPEMEF